MSKYDNFVIDYAGDIGSIQAAIDSLLTACKRKDEIINKLLAIANATGWQYSESKKQSDKELKKLTADAIIFAVTELNREEI